MNRIIFLFYKRFLCFYDYLIFFKNKNNNINYD